MEFFYSYTLGIHLTGQRTLMTRNVRPYPNSGCSWLNLFIPLLMPVFLSHLMLAFLFPPVPACLIPLSVRDMALPRVALPVIPWYPNYRAGHIAPLITPIGPLYAFARYQRSPRGDHQ